MLQKNLQGRGGGIDLLKEGQISGSEKVMLWQFLEPMLSRQQILHSITAYSEDTGGKQSHGMPQQNLRHG